MFLIPFIVSMIICNVPLDCLTVVNSLTVYTLPSLCKSYVTGQTRQGLYSYDRTLSMFLLQDYPFLETLVSRLQASARPYALTVLLAPALLVTASTGTHNANHVNISRSSLLPSVRSNILYLNWNCTESTF